MEVINEKIKIFLKNTTEGVNNINNYNDFNLQYIPEEELKLFINSLKEFHKNLLKFSKPNLQKQDLEKWILIYLYTHNLFHSQIQENESNDLIKTELITTAPIFKIAKETLKEDDYIKLTFSYFLLGLTALQINHSLEYLISEKLILGEFVSVGGLEKSIWGLKFKHNVLLEVVDNLLDKIKRDRINLLVKKYRNITFDFFII